MIQPVLRGEKSVHCRDVKGLQPQDSVGGGGGEIWDKSEQCGPTFEGKGMDSHQNLRR